MHRPSDRKCLVAHFLDTIPPDTLTCISTKDKSFSFQYITVYICRLSDIHLFQARFLKDFICGVETRALQKCNDQDDGAVLAFTQSSNKTQKLCKHYYAPPLPLLKMFMKSLWDGSSVELTRSVKWRRTSILGQEHWMGTVGGAGLLAVQESVLQTLETAGRPKQLIKIRGFLSGRLLRSAVLH